ncbi:MAG: nucleoside deaminase [Alphaproteobacteria bacterium]|nr:nucleoside deaminase [Alphaproteobacteria bacterium]
MRRAIELSRVKMRAGEGGPFGAVVVYEDRIVGEGWNRVLATRDPTAHAEIVAIREACQRLGRFSLDGAEIYATAEPCPMCLGAILWARIGHLYYGNTRVEAAAIGFDDAAFYDEVARPPDQRTLPSERLLAAEARVVFAEWDAKPDKVRY